MGPRTDSCHIGDEIEKSFPLKIGYTIAKFWMIDIVGYGILIPLIGSILAGAIAKKFELGMGQEIVLTVALTMMAMFLAFYFCSEQSYWKCLFQFDAFCQAVLRIRDLINTVVILACVYSLACLLQEMVVDKSIKPTHMNEGVLYVVFKSLFRILRVDEEWGLSLLGLKLPSQGTLFDPSFGKNERFEHAACLMLLCAMLSASVAKAMYFNSLFTYLRSMNIFLSLHPIFESDENSSMRSVWSS